MTELVAAQPAQSRGIQSIVSTQTLVPEQLSGEEREELAREMLGLIAQIFDGPWLQGLADGIAKGGLGRTTLQRYFNEAGQCVGFAALFLDEFEQDGEPWSVFRGFAGLLPEYRTRQSIMQFYFATGAPYLLKNPGRRAFFFAPLVHVSSYRVVARHVPEMYPHPAHELSPELQAVMQRLGERYGCKPVEGEHPLVCRRSAWVRETPGASPRPAGAADEIDQFFHQLNPRVGDGLCLMTLVPVSPRHLPGIALRLASTWLTRPLRELQRAWDEAAG
jgi:hypothetical protein